MDDGSVHLSEMADFRQLDNLNFRLALPCLRKMASGQIAAIDITATKGLRPGRQIRE
jgi:hypothetical protein